MHLPTRINGTADDHDRLARVAGEAWSCRGNVDAALELARTIGANAPQPGSGATAELWNLLSTIAAADVTVARVIEPHLDALSILDQADPTRLEHPTGLESLGVTSDSTWGVFAAEAPGAQLDATVTGDHWVVDGTKAWCSLADSLSHALVTARTSSSTRGLFAVDLKAPGVTVREGTWHATGLSAVSSGPVDFVQVEAVPVGGENWYLDRPGFAWGGIGVAACWWGGAMGIARRAFAAAESREPDQVALMHLGALDAALHTARVALAEAATAVDAHETDRESAAILANRTRSVVAYATEEVIARTGRALGPAPLALEADHARRVADLQLYVRQHHGERDLASLGRKLLERRTSPW